MASMMVIFIIYFKGIVDVIYNDTTFPKMFMTIKDSENSDVRRRRGLIGVIYTPLIYSTIQLFKVH